MNGMAHKKDPGQMPALCSLCSKPPETDAKLFLTISYPIYSVTAKDYRVKHETSNSQPLILQIHKLIFIYYLVKLLP